MSSHTLFLVLGDQLFAHSLYGTHLTGSVNIFMREDRELCTRYKFHKQKIHFFLTAMRRWAQKARSLGWKIHYEKLGEDLLTYEEALEKHLRLGGFKKVVSFEIVDQLFAVRIKHVLKSVGVAYEEWPSPMFLTPTREFEVYLKKIKRPFMKTFYEHQRKRLGVLLDQDGLPLGGKWSFDSENRQGLPRNISVPDVLSYKPDSLDHAVAKLVSEHFPEHPGSSENFWLPTDHSGAEAWLKHFIKYQLSQFGPYQDALEPRYPFLFHSVLSPFLNTGLLIPAQVLENILTYENQVPLASLEGFIRQLIGWREFIRGVYLHYDEKQKELNFFGHKRRLKSVWYTGNTGIAPLDNVIQKTLQYGYAHHIERLMVLGSLMLLLQVHPQDAYRWFMEMFIDSADWVMGPNVFGMALFSDGGIFATKPYFCGSNYYRKMGPYKDGAWQIEVDGLYWTFIERNRDFFAKQARLSFMVQSWEKMPFEKKQRLRQAAQSVTERLTQAE